MKRTISSVLVLGLIAAMLSIFAGAASAQTDEGKAQIQAVNGTDKTVSVTADGTDLGTGLQPGDAGTAALVPPGQYTITFTDDADGTTVVATYSLTVAAVTAWNVVSGYGDPNDQNAKNAAAYQINLDEATPAVVFANSSAVPVTVTPGDVKVAQGEQSAAAKPAAFTVTPDGGTGVDVDLSAVADTSYTSVVAVGADAGFALATVTIDNLADLKASLEPGTGQVTVPDVVGQTEADATAAIEGAGLVVAKTEAADEGVPAGEVISQDPTAGTTVNAGDTVNIVVSTGPDVPATVPVPDVAGKAAADAQAELEAAGFTVTSEEQESMDVEAGLVIETNPSAGTEVATGSEVKMIVSSGAGEIIVPNFVGMTQDDATKAAEEVGLTITFVEDPDNPDPDGVVASQDPTAGAKAEAGSEVVAQLTPKVEDAWVILTLNPNRLLTASGINFQPGSTVELAVLNSDKKATATVQEDGTWVTTADLSDVDNQAELLLVKGTAADGSAYEETFKIPAAGSSTDEPTEAVQEESSGTPVWLWIVLAALVVAIVALGWKMFGNSDSTDGGTPSGGDDAPKTDTSTTDSN